MSKPRLLPDALSAEFSQPMDSCGDAEGICNVLKVEIADAGAGAYLVIKTERWAFDADDIPQIVDALRWMLANVKNDAPPDPPSRA